MLEKTLGENVHPAISNIFMAAATEAIKRMSDVSFHFIFFYSHVSFIIIVWDSTRIW